LLSPNVKVKANQTIILPLLCGFETWFFKLMDEHGMGVFVNRLARNIFEPKGENVSRRERKLHNLELRDV